MFPRFVSMLLRLALFFLLLFGTSVSFAQTDTLKRTGDCKLYAPNIVTMNCDNAYHDYLFEVISNCKYSSAHMTVYDRWGNVVFDESMTAGKNIIWDASEQKDGSFYYIFSGFFVGGIPFELKETVMVLK